jgi:hypothetical protein
VVELLRNMRLPHSQKRSATQRNCCASRGPAAAIIVVVEITRSNCTSTPTRKPAAAISDNAGRAVIRDAMRLGGSTGHWEWGLPKIPAFQILRMMLEEETGLNLATHRGPLRRALCPNNRLKNPGADCDASSTR